MKDYQKTAKQEVDSINRSLNIEKAKLIHFEEEHFKKEEGLRHDIENINTKSILITKKEGLISLNKEKKNIITPRLNSKKSELERATVEHDEIKIQLDKLITETRTEKGKIEVINQSLQLRETTNQELANEIADLRNKNIELSKTASQKKDELESKRRESTTVNQAILDIDQNIEVNSKRINDDINTLSNWREENKNTLKEIDRLNSEIERNRSNLKDTTLSIDEKEKLRILISKQTQLLSEQENNQEKQLSEITQLTEEIENIKNENTNLRKGKDNKESELVRISGDISSKKREIERLTEKTKYNESEITAKSSLRNKFQLEIELQQSQRSNLKSKISSNTIAINDYKAETVDLKSKIATLETDISELEIQLSNIEVENQSLSNEIRLLSNEIETMKVEVGEFKPELKKLSMELKKEKQRINVLNKELELDIEKVKELKYEIDSVSNYVRKLENPAEDLILDLVDICQKSKEDSIKTNYNLIKSNSPKNHLADAIMSYYYVYKKDLNQALIHLNMSVKNNPRDQDIILLRADINARQKNYLAAIKDYDQVAYIDEGNKTALIERGKIYLVNLNDRNNGCNDMKKALKLGYFESNAYVQKYCSGSAQITAEVHQLTKIASKHSYGYTRENPIQVGQSEGNPYKNVIDYLNLLRDGKGDPVTFAKAGRCCPYKTENGINGEALLDMYKVFYRDEKGKKTETKLFFTIYDYELPKVPIGFKTEHEIY